MEMGLQDYKNIQIFKDHITSFKEASKDTESKESVYMTNSEIQVINFDKVKESYIKGMSLSKAPCSNDALYIGKDNKFYFVEFKNGVMNKNKVFNINVIYLRHLTNDLYQNKPDNSKLWITGFQLWKA